MKKLLNSTAKKIALCYVLYHILGIAVYFTTQSYFFLVWNLFLSIVPLFFARLLERSLGKRHWSIICVLSLFWLLFYPNAPYMVTDLMHLRWLRFDSADTVQNILSWIRLLYLALGVLLGGLAGNLSLYKVHRLLSLHWGRWKARFCLAVIFLLSGYAIYIGRFLRLNSWDIV
ncbi:MAG: DUF1361 domain-containing protein, partial [Oscillospiraceae bacterium]|nr:DUF1361 domain-containing protein [Oscillospiraceae bacterium]